MIKIPFLLFNPKAFESRRTLLSVAKMYKTVNPNLPFHLRSLYYNASAESYFLACVLSFFVYFIILSLLVFAMLFVLLPPDKHESLLLQSIGLGFVFAFLFFSLLLIYPSIIVKKISSQKNKDVLFALREIILSVNSGITLFDAIKNVSSSDYGFVSEDLRRVVLKIESGYSEKDALKELAIVNQNDYMKRAAWQMINSIETGARVGVSLTTVTNSLETEMYRTIRNYSASLNFLMLIYLLGAAAVPSIGIAFMVLLSAFGGAGIDVIAVGFLIAGTTFFQIVLIGFISSTRPNVFGG